MKHLFEIYSSFHEYDNDVPDEFGRSRIYNTKNVEIFNPVISKCIFKSGFRPYYPDNKSFAVCISHDIDHLYTHQSRARNVINASKEFIRGDWSNISNYLGGNRKINKDFDLKRLVSLNAINNIRSSYYFLSLDLGERDFNYEIEKIGDQIRIVEKGNCEVGLHGGHNACQDFNKLLKEKEKLQKTMNGKVEGYRNHFLRFDLPLTWNNLSNAGFLYDTTFGYADCIGFRNGMCYPFIPYDVKADRFINNIIELPLIIMDATIFYYMRLNEEIGLKLCQKLCKEIKECGGVLTLLWHNNFMTGDKLAFYMQLIQVIKQEDPWFVTSSDLVKWWRDEKLIDQSQEIIRSLIRK